MVTIDTLTGNMCNEVRADFADIMAKDGVSSLIVGKYLAERKSEKINKTERHVRTYPITTANKNNWIIIVSKPFYDAKFKGRVTIDAIMYLEDESGYAALKCQDNIICLYDAAFWIPYLETGSPATLDSIIDFFKTNDIMDGKTYDAGRDRLFVGCARNGAFLFEVERRLNMARAVGWLPRASLSNIAHTTATNNIVKTMADLLASPEYSISSIEQRKSK